MGLPRRDDRNDGGAASAAEAVEGKGSPGGATVSVAAVLGEASAVPTSDSNNKCLQCHRRPAAKSCAHRRCAGCCDDPDGCEHHKRLREQAQVRAQILEGTAPAQLLAGQIRSKLLPSKRFREKSFVYQGDTVRVWDLREFASRHPKAADDAVRKSLRRRQRLSELLPPPPPGAARETTTPAPGRLSGGGRRARRFRQLLRARLGEMGGEQQGGEPTAAALATQT